MAHPDKHPSDEPSRAHPLSPAAFTLQQAEKRVREETPEHIEALSPEAVQLMLHELRVHQIELEMQNEELRRTQVQLEAARASYFDLYDLAPVGYCTVNMSGLVQQANLTAALLLGMARGALVTQPLSRFIFKEDQDIYYLCRRQLLETDAAQTCELRMVQHDGTLIWARLAITAAQDDSGAPVLRMALTDVTQSTLVAVAMQGSVARYRTLSEALRAKNLELEHSKTAAEQANRAKSDFLSSMSHELRTPLSAILGFAQLIESGAPPPTPSQQQSLNQVLKAGWYLLELINEILDLAQVESGKLLLSMETVSLTEIVHECQTMITPQAQKSGIRVDFSPLTVPYFVKADWIRVKQVLINLLSNAIKYNKKNGTVTVRFTVSTPGRIRIGIEDTGEGLPPEKLAQLFQPFNRLGKEGGAEEGTGIGLVVSKRLVELMGGVIGVESTVGKGSVFWIELNLTAAPQAAAELTVLAPAPIQANAPVRTLLYVEDNPANMMLVEEIIARRSDLRLLSATDGRRGIELARAAQPDIILMDINLPDINGIEALKILRVDPVTKHIPVVALSANAMPHDIEQGLAAGFFRYLTKPIKINEFMDTLDVALKFSQTALDGAVIPGAQ